MYYLFKGESNLIFVWFLLAQTGITIPSISAVKKFTLPGFQQPTKVNEVLLVLFLFFNIQFSWVLEYSK